MIDKITKTGDTDFGGVTGPQQPADAADFQDSYPTPPPIPTVDRETGAVSTVRTEDIGQLDGWVNSTDPTEGHSWNQGPDWPRPNKRHPYEYTPTGSLPF